MNVLIVYAHPNPQSFSHAIKETVATACKVKGHAVRVRDLYALPFNPVLSGDDFSSFKNGKIPPDIAVEQDHIRWAQLIVVINPIWWASVPAVLKGYFDRVLSFGFAFTVGPEGNKGLLPDKKVYIFNTLGNSQETYTNNGMFQSISQTIDMGVFKFCAMSVLGHTYFASVPSVSQDTRRAMLEQVKGIVSKF